jgi:hypothetical protein
MNVTLTLICYKNGDFTAKMIIFQQKKVTLQQKQVAPQTYLIVFMRKICFIWQQPC